MSLWQYLMASYDQNADAMGTNYPLSTTSISNNSEWIAVIIINGSGEFQDLYKIEKAKWDKKTREFINPYVTINIPATEKSAGRTSGPEPYPVFDQYEYLKGTGRKFELYIKQLEEFANSDFATPQVKAIHAYITKKTVAFDLKHLSPKSKTNIVFEVQIAGNPQSKVWESPEFFNAWHQYYLSVKNKLSDEKRLARVRLSGKEKLSKGDKGKIRKQADCDEGSFLDYISGTMQLAAISHPKKISNASANAKLISDNDTDNFTFRGRFENSTQAMSIGYESSQKAHQFLRYLVSDRGSSCGEQVILSFTIGSMQDILPRPLDDTKSIYDFMEKNSVQKTSFDKQITLRAETGLDYAKALKEALAGFKYGNALDRHAKTAVLVLDSAIPGRLAVTFYRELNCNTYIEKIAKWHEGCKWNQQFWNDDTQKYVQYIGAPSIDRIIEAVFGKPRSNRDDSYKKIKKTARERLLRCIFDGAFLPADYVVAAFHRASNPLAVTKNGKFDRNGYAQILSTVCALVRKEIKQRKKEDYKLSLESTRTDRSYLYGRLLGAADKLEEYALYKKDKGRAATAAIRYMQAFSQRPFRTWQIIHESLVPYIQTVKGGFAFREIENVKNLFVTGDFENEAPLSGSYLIGYYHERAYIDKLIATKSNKKAIQEDTKETENE